MWLKPVILYHRVHWFWLFSQNGAQKPDVDSKWSSKTLFQNTCFGFLIRFVRFLASKLAKIQIWYKKFLLHKFNMGIKKRIWCGLRIVWNNCKKINSSKKIISVSLLHIVIKVKKIHFSITFYNFSPIFGNFSTDSKSASNQILLFCYPYWIDETQNVLILALFANFEAKTTRNGS